MKQRPDDGKRPLGKGVLPISPPSKSPGSKRSDEDAPDLRIEEIEEKQIPKDRNIFDK